MNKTQKSKLVRVFIWGLFCGVALLFIGCAAHQSPVARYLAKNASIQEDKDGALNPYVLHVISAYPTDSSYPYRWEKNEYDIYNGVTEDLVYRDKIIARGHPNQTRCSNCCGLTFEIFFRAMQLRNKQKGITPDDFNGMAWEDLFNMMLIWFVVGSGDSPREAIAYYGLGQAIENWEEARAGDFMDISRNSGSGHSVIFIEWQRDDSRKITGMKYFSSQKSGVGYATEYFSDSGGKVLRKHIHIGRVGRIEDYKPFERSLIPNRN